MPTYNYKAINARGSMIRGQMTATGDIELEEKLSKLGLELITAKEKGESRARFGLSKNVGPKEQIMFCVHMEQMERAGVPLLEALEDLRDSVDSPKFQELLNQIHESIKNGKLFSEALQEHPKVFGNVFVGLVSAGEKTGNLADAFGHLAEHLKWQQDIRRRIKKATRYPIVLVFVLMAVISLMMLFVVPQLTEFLRNHGFDLPFHTRMLIAISDTFVNYWFIIFSVPIAAYFAITLLYKTSENFAYHIDSLMLRLPVLGPVFKKIELARFAQFFSVTFRSGIDIIDCLNTSMDVVNNRVVKEAVYFVRQGVSEGTPLTDALRISNQFPSLVIRMFKMGEDSGKMSEALENVNFFYEREVNDSVDTMVEMIQPALTVVLGGILFWIIASVFGPLYGSFEKINF